MTEGAAATIPALIQRGKLLLAMSLIVPASPQLPTLGPGDAMDASFDEAVHTVVKEFEQRVRQSVIVVALLGSEGKGLDERRVLASTLAPKGVLALIPEDHLPREVSPSLAEGALLSKGDIDLVFLNVESWGTATEFGQFSENPEIARKLRVMVKAEYHPFHGTSMSLLSDAYLNHLVAHGHLYPVDGNGQIPAPTLAQVVTIISERHRQIKAIRPDLLK